MWSSPGIHHPERLSPPILPCAHWESPRFAARVAILTAPSTGREAPRKDLRLDDAGLLLVIDIGNTSIALGVYRERELLATYRIATDQDNLADEYGMLVLALLRSKGIEPASIGAA